MFQVSYYLVDELNADAAMVNTYSAITYLPWCLKIFFGVFSDCVPIMGWHRRPYFISGWVVFVLSNIWLWIDGSPGTTSIFLLSFVMSMGYLKADTVADAMIVEATANEVESAKGRMRTQGYLIRSVGMTIGGLMGACLYNKAEWGWGMTIGQCFLVQALLPLVTLFPTMPFMHEIKYRGEISTFKQKWTESWNFVVTDAVWIPLMYLYFYNFCYVSNPAWYNFLYDGLNFSDFQVGILYTIGSLLGALGIWMYDTCFFSQGWRPLYMWTTVVSTLFSFLQLCLLYGWTAGMPNIVFATGDVSLQSAVQYISFMPMCIMFLAMIPDGQEGTLYAMITTWQNVAAEVAYDIGTLLECAVTNTSNEAIEEGHWGGLIKLTYITSAVQIFPIFFIYCKYKGVACLPNSTVETKAQWDAEKTSYSGAFLFMFLFIGSIAASMFEAVYVIYYPGAC